MNKSKFLSFLSILLVFGCQDYTPKPKAYPRVIYPEKAYVNSQSDCPFEFDIPTYSELKAYPGGEDCWYNLIYTPFDATLHLSYIPVTSPEALDSMREDAYKMSLNKHHIQRAEEILERELKDTVKGLYGMLYDLEGKTATPLNFYLTDKKKHFFRGSFYFNKKTSLDSVAPIYSFLREDIIRSIESFNFK